MASQDNGCNGRLQDLKKYYILGEVLALVDLSLVRLRLPAALHGPAWPHCSCKQLTVAGKVSGSRQQTRPVHRACLTVCVGTYSQALQAEAMWLPAEHTLPAWACLFPCQASAEQSLQCAADRQPAPICKTNMHIIGTSWGSYCGLVAADCEDGGAVLPLGRQCGQPGD